MSLKSQAVSQFQLPWLMVGALIFFIVFFTGVVIWVYRKNSNALYKEIEQLPLEGEQRHER